MSVIVNGMEMPDHCWECWLMRNMICGASGELIPSTGKRKYCPLVALPDKHGRLINADELIEDVDGDLTDSIAEGRAIEKIMEAPTIVEAED